MVVLGLGSNCDNRLGYLRQAIQHLKSSHLSSHLQLLAVSPIYESDALLPEGAPPHWNQPFLNLCVLCRTDLSPLELLKHTQWIEKVTGRKQRARWAPREIDIDILSMGSLEFSDDSLKIPHPSLEQRPFATLPLADLAPHWKTPKPEWRSGPSESIPFRTQRSTLFLPELVGILNITPDSFSDGGIDLNSEASITRGLNLISQGVQILDLGAEATGPGALTIQPMDEWDRLEPVLGSLKSPLTRISIDTRNAEVASRAIKMGANWINDVTGLQNPEMRKVASESNADWVIMHSLTVPPQKDKVLPFTKDPISTLLSWGEERIESLEKSGIPRKRLIFDPGIGYGKTIDQTWEIIKGIQKFHELGVRILVGHSRKSFFSSLSDRKPIDRDLETCILSTHLASNGVDYIRIHNPEINFRSLKLWTQIDGMSWFRKAE